MFSVIVSWPISVSQVGQNLDQKLSVGKNIDQKLLGLKIQQTQQSLS
jgi:hypothetical protein